MIGRPWSGCDLWRVQRPAQKQIKPSTFPIQGFSIFGLAVTIHHPNERSHGQHQRRARIGVNGQSGSLGYTYTLLECCGVPQFKATSFNNLTTNKHTGGIAKEWIPLARKKKKKNLRSRDLQSAILVLWISQLIRRLHSAASDLLAIQNALNRLATGHYKVLYVLHLKIAVEF